MKWQTKNHLGEVVTWYSEDVIEKIKEYINQQGIDNKWNMRIQRFRQGILQIIEGEDNE